MRPVLVTTAALLVSLLVAEGLVRLFDPLGISYYTEISRHMAWMEDDPARLWRLPAGARARFQAVEVITDAGGLRVDPRGAPGSEYARPPARREERILWIGDSVVFGWGVRAESTFVGRLEGLLSSDSLRVSCSNAAVCGYDSEQELVALREHLERIDPDRVALVYVGNDMELSRPLDRRVLFLRQSRLYQLVRHTLRFARGDPGQRRHADRSADGWGVSMRSVAAMADTCRARGLSFTVYLYGMDDSAVRRAVWEDLSGLSREHRFQLVDVLPWFAGIDIRALTNSIADGHANTRAHGILARRMADGWIWHTPGLPRTGRRDPVEP